MKRLRIQDYSPKTGGRGERDQDRDCEIISFFVFVFKTGIMWRRFVREEKEYVWPSLTIKN
jgi:hypothetical protein